MVLNLKAVPEATVNEEATEQHVEMHADNIAAYLQENHEKANADLKNFVKPSMTESFIAVSFVIELMYEEIERLGKEMLPYQELFFHFSNKSLTTERWLAIVNKIRQHREERKTELRKKKEEVQLMKEQGNSSQH